MGKCGGNVSIAGLCLLVFAACSGGAHIDVTHVTNVDGAGTLPGSPVTTFLSVQVGSSQSMSSSQYRAFSSQTNVVSASQPTSSLYRLGDPLIESAIAAQE